MAQGSNTSPRASQRGFDAPIFDPSADTLGRGSFGRRVYDLLCPRDADFSVRVGLTGDWGSGKTSIAGWVERYAIEDEHKVIWYNPWSVTSIDGLWLTFYDALRNGLKLEVQQEAASGRSPGLLSRLKALVSSNAETVAAIGQLHSFLGKAAEEGAIQSNARSLLALIVGNRLPYLEGTEFDRKIAQDQRVITLLWQALTAQPVQYRMHESIRKIREELIQKGFPEAELYIPAWLATDSPAAGS